MFWKVVALFGSGSFFFVGWGVLTDPSCNSVSFRGGGARTVVTTCYPDGSGDFSKLTAVTGSWLIGLAILGFLFWPTLKVFLRNHQFKQKLSEVINEQVNQKDFLEKDIETQGASADKTSSQFTLLLRKLLDNKLIASILVIVLLFGFYKIAAPKISLLNPITCSNLKKELAAKDIIGREIWNSYQVEVSNLSRSPLYSNEYYLQVGNTARRALQLASNDLEGYLMMNKKTHCVRDEQELTKLINEAKLTIDYLSGSGSFEGKKFDVYNGWNTSYYNTYRDFSELLQ